jgi:hypothetical protein
MGGRPEGFKIVQIDLMFDVLLYDGYEYPASYERPYNDYSFILADIVSCPDSM